MAIQWRHSTIWCSRFEYLADSADTSSETWPTATEVERQPTDTATAVTPRYQYSNAAHGLASAFPLSARRAANRWFLRSLPK